MPTPASSIAREGSSARTSAGTWRPVRRKTKPLSRNVIVSQTARPASRASAPMMRDPRRPRYRPAATVAITPDAPSCSAGRKAAYGVRSEIVISTGVSSIRERMWAMSHPTARPIAHPPSMASAKVATAVVGENDPPTATAMAMA